jgi:hypothetical protein
VEHDDGKIRVTKNVIIVMKEKPGNFQFSYGKYIGWETGPIDTAFKLITFQGVYVRAIKDNPFYICPIKSKDKNYQRIHML